MKQKNDGQKSGRQLPLYGVGPVFGAVIVILTLVGIYLDSEFIVPKLTIMAIDSYVPAIGVVFIVLSIVLYLQGAFFSKLDTHIKENELVTTGVYSCVRNPIYSAILFLSIGVLLLYKNLVLLIFPVIGWVFLTILMRCTEEKWLEEVYGEEYLNYKKHVNRCIPFFPRG